MYVDYSFQKDIQTKIIKNLLKENACVLGAAPASGKTRMSIKIVEELIKKKRWKKF